MSRLTVARTELTALVADVVPDRAFASEADAGSNVPAVYVDGLTIGSTQTAAVVEVEATLMVVVDGADHAQVELSDTYADALWQALLFSGWPPSRCEPDQRLTVATDDTASLPKLTGYRITCGRRLRLDD